jgi:hypothetical protein
MNLDLDPSVFSRFFRGILTELRQKKLWPVAVVLLLACVAVPLLLSKSSSPAAQPQAQIPTPPPAGGSSIPALNVQTTPSNSKLSGPSRNPFGNGTSTTSTTASTTPVTSGGSSSATTVTGASSGGASSSTSSSSGGSSGAFAGSSPSSGSSSGNPPSITQGAKPKPAPPGLKADQTYDVSLAMTGSNGDLNTTDPLQRLSVLPSDQQPLLVELGVEYGGGHVLFAVEPGAVVFGPGTCTPGPIDCEILSLGQDQTEELLQQQGTVGASEVALFAVTGVSTTDYPSTAAADKARRNASAAGRSVLEKAPTSALSLFQYEPSLGSVIDLRNLKVGG